MILDVFFWVLVFLLFHSYLLFPLILLLLSRGKKENRDCWSRPEDFPRLSILMSVFNEQKVIREKIHSLMNTTYPAGRMEILAGSDGSTDETNEILRELAAGTDRIKLFIQKKRKGKGSMINRLAKAAEGEILVFTDANVILQRNTLTELVKHFRNPAIGLTDSYMLNTGIKKDGISYQEMAYISREVKIKYREGLIWGCMMGPFGGCFAFRRSLFSPIPETVLVDDFFINMLVLERGYRSINELHSRVYEDVSNELFEEFRRKVRIAAGNFQNLWRFRRLLWPPWTGKGFCFLSHKVIRWFGPFILAGLLFSNAFLAGRHPLYLATLLLQCVLLALPFLDLLLRKIQLHIVILRFITHFYAMNLALFIGFMKTLKGVKTNVWQPTRRYQ